MTNSGDESGVFLQVSVKALARCFLKTRHRRTARFNITHRLAVDGVGSLGQRGPLSSRRRSRAGHPRRPTCARCVEETCELADEIRSILNRLPACEANSATKRRPGYSSMNEIKFAFRQLLKNPGFTALAMLTLGLCLGANLTIFAVIDSVLLRALPFPEPDRLVTLFNTYPKAGVERDGASLPNYYERRGNIPAFARVSILRHDKAIVGEVGSTEQVD